MFKPLGSAWGFLSRFCCQGNTHLRFKLTLIGVFVTAFCFALPAFQAAPAPAAPTRSEATCNAACHAQGIAAAERRIDVALKSVEQGRTCYPAGSNRLTTHVAVRGAYIGTERVSLVKFDRAWAMNHNTNPGDDVWVLARCN